LKKQILQNYHKKASVDDYFEQEPTPRTQSNKEEEEEADRALVEEDEDLLKAIEMSDIDHPM